MPKNEKYFLKINIKNYLNVCVYRSLLHIVFSFFFKPVIEPSGYGTNQLQITTTHKIHNQ